MSTSGASPGRPPAEVTAILAHRAVMEAISALAVQRETTRTPGSLARGLDMQRPAWTSRPDGP